MTSSSSDPSPSKSVIIGVDKICGSIQTLVLLLSNPDGRTPLWYLDQKGSAELLVFEFHCFPCVTRMNLDIIDKLHVKTCHAGTMLSLLHYFMPRGTQYISKKKTQMRPKIANSKGPIRLKSTHKKAFLFSTVIPQFKLLFSFI